MADIKKSAALKSMPEANGCIDAYAELASFTGFDSPAGSFVNVAFLVPQVISLIDDAGTPNGSTVSLKKVCSVTMTKARAEALYEALGRLLSKESEK